METKQPKRSGVLRCGVCGKALKQATWVPMFVCPDSKCINSEENLDN
jgi:phage FluMu protein Com